MNPIGSFHAIISQLYHDTHHRYPFFSGLRGLISLFVIAVTLTFLTATHNSSAADMLFQSPQSPVVQPAAQPTSTNTKTPPTSTSTPTQASPATEKPSAPTLSSTNESPSTEVPSTEVVPTDEEPAINETEIIETEEPASEQSVPETSTPLPTDKSTTFPTKSSPESGRSPSINKESSRSPIFTLDRSELIDTVVTSGCYVWACCGIGLFLLIPLFLLFLQIRGRSQLLALEEENL